MELTRFTKVNNIFVKSKSTIMRKLLLIIFVLGQAALSFGQQRALPPKEYQNKMAVRTPDLKGGEVPGDLIIPGEKSKSILEETEIGITYYGSQTNRGMQERIYLFDDGTLGAVWTKAVSVNGPRGTGYNYYDGSAWGPDGDPIDLNYDTPGWPSYAPFGENGEVYTAHDYYAGTLVGLRDEKGTGSWNQSIQAGPSGAEDISYPRVTTSGPDRGIIHILSTTYAAYNGQEAALLYARSSDGAATWEVENATFDVLGPDYYLEIGADTYEWADPKDDLIAFLVGETWNDLLLMKSYDGGDTWTSTMIWECPYPLYSGGVTDTFYCPDGSHDLAIDNEGKVHVVFSLTKTFSDDGSTGNFWPDVDGIVYWNEDMPLFSNDINALNPYGHPDSELIEDYNLVAWSQDLNGNGELDILAEWGNYNTGLSSQPQIAIDDQNRIFLVYSSVTEGYDNGTLNFRHLWARASPNGGQWWGKFVDLNEDLIYIFDECVFPSLSSSSDDFIHLIYQADAEPESSTYTDYENYIRYMKLDKNDLISGIADNVVLSETAVSQNYPNPFNGTTLVYVDLKEKAEISLEVTNMMGQSVLTIPARTFNAGNVELTIDASHFESGVYFYTVRSGKSFVTKKMIAE